MDECCSSARFILQATWKHGYWIRDMTQECFTGVHKSLYLPIGIVSTLVFCVGPPLTTFVLLWRHREKLQTDTHIKQRYGFLYHRYQEQWFFWEVRSMGRHGTTNAWLLLVRWQQLGRVAAGCGWEEALRRSGGAGFVPRSTRVTAQSATCRDSGGNTQCATPVQTVHRVCK